MRSLFTAITTFLFAVGFAGFFVVTSVLGYLADEDAFVATARRAELRVAIVDAVEANTMANLAEDPLSRTIQGTGFRALVDRAITDEWLEAKLREVHAAVIAAVDEAAETAVIDLVATKQILGDAVREARANGTTTCKSLFGEAACTNRTQIERLMAGFERSIGVAIARIPNAVDLVELTTGADQTSPEISKRTEEVRRALGWARAARWIALAVLAIALLVIAAINAPSWARMTRASGAALLVGAVFYLVVVYGYIRVASDQLERASAKLDNRPRVEQIATVASARLARAAIRDSAHRASWQVGGLGVLGLTLIVVGALVPRRRG